MQGIDSSAYPNQPELALAALLYMLTRATHSSSAALNDAIATHLQMVAHDARHTESLRKVARELAGEWACKALGPSGSATH